MCSWGHLSSRYLEIDTRAGDSKGRVGTRGGYWTGLVRVVKEEEESEKLSGEIGGGRNYKGRRNLGKWCLLLQRITLFTVKTDLVHVSPASAYRADGDASWLFSPWCVKRVGHDAFIRAKCVKKLKMHRHCWGHMAAGTSLGRDTGCCWTEEPLVIGDENYQASPLGFSWVVVALHNLLLILKGAC